MRVLEKRAVALIIDVLLIVAVTLIVNLLWVFYWRMDVTNWFADAEKILFVLLFCLRDLPGRNGSIGKKIMGLRIYSRTWKKPGILVLLRRDVISVIWICQYIKNRLIDKNNVLNAFYLEKAKTKTYVIEKTVYSRLIEEAEAIDGGVERNMTELYIEYMKKIYVKA